VRSTAGDLAGVPAGGQDEEESDEAEELDPEGEVDGDDEAEADEEADDAEDFVAPDSWVLDLLSEDLASEEAVLAAGFSASIAFFLDSDG
jgi:hypothetical protein